MGDTDHWLRFRCAHSGRSLWCLWDPDDDGLAFSLDGRVLFRQRSDAGKLHTVAYAVATGERLPDERLPGSAGSVIQVADWQQQHGCWLVGRRASEAKRLHVPDAALSSVDDADDISREALLERLLAGPPTAERWQQILAVLRTWRGRAARRALKRVGRAAQRFATDLRREPDWLRWADPHPVRELVASLPETLTLRPDDLPSKALVHIARSPALATVRCLKVLPGGELCGAAVEALAASEHSTTLRSLYLAGNPIGPRGVAALAGSPRLRALEYVDLSGCGLGDEGAVALACHDGLTGLRLLDLSANGIGDVGAAALAEWSGLARLSRLDLPGNGIGDSGAQALASSGHFARLRILTLQGNPLGPQGARALASAPFDRPLFNRVVAAPYLREIRQDSAEQDFLWRWQRDAALQRATALRGQAPELLRLHVLRRHRQLLSPVVLLACSVLEVKRSAAGVAAGDTVHVAWPRSEWPPHPATPKEGQAADAYLVARSCPQVAWDKLGRHLRAQHPATAHGGPEGEHGYFAAAAGVGTFEAIAAARP